jgi:hypothetical protein
VGLAAGEGGMGVGDAGFREAASGHGDVAIVERASTY